MRWLTRERMLIGAILLLVVVGTGVVTTLLLERQENPDDVQPTVVASPEAQPTPTPPAPETPPPAATATLVIAARPAGASVQIDDKWVVYDAAGARYEVKAQEPVKVRVQADGYSPYETTVSLLAGAERALDIELERLTGTLVVTTRPTAATVFIGNEPRGQSPLTLDQIPLDRDTALRVEKDGYVAIKRSIAWDAGGERLRTLDFDLEPNPAPPPPRRPPARRARPTPPPVASGGGGTGFLSVTSKQWGSVFVDRAQVAMETPMIGYKVPAGSHRVHVCYAGDRSRCTPSKTVTVTPGKTSVLKF